MTFQSINSSLWGNLFCGTEDKATREVLCWVSLLFTEDWLLQSFKPSSVLCFTSWRFLFTMVILFWDTLRFILCSLSFHWLLMKIAQLLQSWSSLFFTLHYKREGFWVSRLSWFGCGNLFSKLVWLCLVVFIFLKTSQWHRSLQSLSQLWLFVKFLMYSLKFTNPTIKW